VDSYYFENVTASVYEDESVVRLSINFATRPFNDGSLCRKHAILGGLSRLL
jgi:hypothetical protein